MAFWISFFKHGKICSFIIQLLVLLAVFASETVTMVEKNTLESTWLIYRYRNCWAAEELHPEVLRELTDTTARSLPWWKGHTNQRTYWGLKRPTSQSSSRKQEGGTRELQTSQPHLGPWQCYGANPTEAIYKCMDDKTMIRSSSHEFTKGKYPLAKSLWKGQLCEQGEQMLFSLTSARLLTPSTMVSL